MSYDEGVFRRYDDQMEARMTMPEETIVASFDLHNEADTQIEVTELALRAAFARPDEEGAKA